MFNEVIDKTFRNISTATFLTTWWKWIVFVNPLQRQKSGVLLEQCDQSIKTKISNIWGNSPWNLDLQVCSFVSALKITVKL